MRKERNKWTTHKHKYKQTTWNTGWHSFSFQTYGFMKKYECLSYLPPLSDEDTAKQIQYLLNNGWSPCIEFANPGLSEVDQKVIMGPGYYDNRYYTMWKLPMFGCNDPTAVLKEIAECRAEYPESVVRVVGFDSVRQVQMAGFVCQK